MAAPLLCVVGARPNYMKMAPLLRALDATPGAPRTVLVHTGQHYDPLMKERPMADAGLRAPDESLDVRSGSHAVQTAEVMKRFEPLIDAHGPSAVVVVGDVNSTLACALVAAKRHVPVVHVEAGLRSGDRGMPEEVNRVLVDQLSDLLYTTESGARDHLLREGIDGRRVHFVGNLMIDSLHHALPHAVNAARCVAEAGLPAMAEAIGHGYAVVTLHRPSNVDVPQVLAGHVQVLLNMADRLPVLWPVHPRARAQLERVGLWAALNGHPRLACLPPQSYLQMVGLLRDATLVLTDSGGIQEETTALGVPCLTLRSSTERPVTVSHGTNRLVGIEAAAVTAAIHEVLGGGVPAGRLPDGWDGRSAQRLASHLLGALGRRQVGDSGDAAPWFS